MTHKNGKRPTPAASTPKKRVRKSRASTVPSTVAKIPQPHGGALNAGGTPGNKGGPPPSLVRQRARGSFYDRIPILEEIADGGALFSADRIRAIATLGNIGMSGTISVDDVRERLRGQLAIIRGMLSVEQADALITALERNWRGDE